MKCYVIGSRESEGVSKKTGKPFHAYNLSVVSYDARTFGFSVTDLYIDVNSAMFGLMVNAFRDVTGQHAVTDQGAFLGAYFDVDFNRSGFIDSIEVLGWDPDAIVFDLDFRTFGEKKKKK